MKFSKLSKSLTLRKTASKDAAEEDLLSKIRGLITEEMDKISDGSGPPLFWSTLLHIFRINPHFPEGHGGQKDLLEGALTQCGLNKGQNYERILGTHGQTAPATSYLFILAIMILAKFTESDICDKLPRFWLRPKERPLGDEMLPLTKNEIIEVVGSDGDLASMFHVFQDKFAIILSRSRRQDYPAAARARLPFKENWYSNYSDKLIDRGGQGVVTKECFAAKHMIIEGRKTPAENQFYACKMVPRGAGDAELEIIKRLESRSLEHKHILLPEIAFRCGGDAYILFELADMNLWSYLTESYPTHCKGAAEIQAILDQTDPFDRARELLWLLYRLSDALAHLHKAENSDGSDRRLAVYHLDLKPQNVLLFWNSERWATETIIGRAKIADFGVSMLKEDCERSARHEHNTVTYTLSNGYQLRDPQMFLAPEACGGAGEVGTMSDIWSFGCIFAFVLAYALDRKAGVEELEKKINSRRENGRKSFFELTDDKDRPIATDQLKREVNEWFENLLKDPKYADERRYGWMTKCVNLLRTDLLIPQSKNTKGLGSSTGNRHGGCLGVKKRRLKAKELKEQLLKILNKMELNIENPNEDSNLGIVTAQRGSSSNYLQPPQNPTNRGRPRSRQNSPALSTGSTRPTEAGNTLQFESKFGSGSATSRGDGHSPQLSPSRPTNLQPSSFSPFSVRLALSKKTMQTTKLNFKAEKVKFSSNGQYVAFIKDNEREAYVLRSDNFCVSKPSQHEPFEPVLTVRPVLGTPNSRTIKDVCITELIADPQINGNGPALALLCVLFQSSKYTEFEGISIYEVPLISHSQRSTQPLAEISRDDLVASYGLRRGSRSHIMARRLDVSPYGRIFLVTSSTVSAIKLNLMYDRSSTSHRISVAVSLVSVESPLLRLKTGETVDPEGVALSRSGKLYYVTVENSASSQRIEIFHSESGPVTRCNSRELRGMNHSELGKQPLLAAMSQRYGYLLRTSNGQFILSDGARAGNGLELPLDSRVGLPLKVFVGSRDNIILIFTSARRFQAIKLICGNDDGDLSPEGHFFNLFEDIKIPDELKWLGRIKSSDNPKWAFTLLESGIEGPSILIVRAYSRSKKSAMVYRFGL